MHVGSKTFHGDLSTGNFRPFAPLPFRRLVFDSIHGVGHPGGKASRRLVTAHFVWPKMNADIGAWARECLSCQRSKVVHHVRQPPEGLVEPLPLSRDCTYIFTIIGQTSRWVEKLYL